MSSGQQPLGAEHPLSRGGANRPLDRTAEERETLMSPSVVPAAEATGLGNPKGPARMAADAADAPDLSRRSAADVLGPEGLQRASVQKVRRSGDPGEGPHLHAPGDAAVEEETGGLGVGGALKKAWHDFKEATPGTSEHEKAYGTRFTMGGYATMNRPSAGPGV